MQVEDTDVEVGARMEAIQAIQALERRAEELRRDTFSRLTTDQRMDLARHPQRPSVHQLMQSICSKFMELHSEVDGRRADCRIGSGVGNISGVDAVIIGYERGWESDREGHLDQSIQLLKEAEAFGFPVVYLVDSYSKPAGSKVEEEEEKTRRKKREGGETEVAKDQLEKDFDPKTSPAQLESLAILLGLKVPIVRVVVGVGGTLDPLPAVVADKTLMLQHAVLYHTVAQSPPLQLCSAQALEGGLVDQVLPEPAGGAHRRRQDLYPVLQIALASRLAELKNLEVKELLAKRRAKFSLVSQFQTGGDVHPSSPKTQAAAARLSEWMGKIRGSNEP
eukprot:CAMPEP_0196577570 /NCGR_PEP_ID=MMETSP1081-20130531/6618_1 /TAXON_ID=36882 /ORGANISM="Pyramimonas amylifera, Strain CCMP720" /LENGTH=334 /DNA_ID=CAMNT_0041896531 /DNA_START=441 /DNA_END=1445 /DNA_ORIENTATION=+